MMYALILLGLYVVTRQRAKRINSTRYAPGSGDDIVIQSTRSQRAISHPGSIRSQGV